MKFFIFIIKYRCVNWWIVFAAGDFHTSKKDEGCVLIDKITLILNSTPLNSYVIGNFLVYILVNIIGVAER